MVSLLGGAPVCARCRRLGPRGGACCAAPALRLDAPDERAALVTWVWGDDAGRLALLRGARSDARRRGLAAALGAAAGLGLGAALGGAAPWLGALGGLLGAAGGGRGAAGRAGDGLHPRGGEPPPPRPRLGVGRVDVATPLEAPGSGARCAAWALELRYVGAWGERTMLRVGACAGLEVALDGGARVRVPAGLVWLGEALVPIGAPERPALAALVRAIDPDRAVGAELWPALPFNLVAEATLALGDRVELGGELDEVLGPATTGGPVPYRVAPPTRLAPRGLVTLARRPA